ncbi:MAG: FliM/FliN family flagellar motor switch protein [Halioglobus sp.]|nr:FliM/FliN family flagellar motor switch protein [Halioglobus sp.]
MSSKDVLSEGELDALSEAFADGEAAGGDPAFDRECEPFDFSTREQNLLAQMPALKNLNEKLALEFGPVLRNLYGITVQVDVEETRLLSLEDVFAELEAPIAVNVVRLAPLNGQAYVVMPAELLSMVVDRYFGGGVGEGAGGVARESLTHSERRVNDTVLEGFLATLTDIWREKISFNPTVESFESNPDFLQVPVPGEQVLCFPFSLRIGEWSTTISWVVPYASMEPLRPKLASSSFPLPQTVKNADWEKHFARELQHVELEVSGAFLSDKVSIADVLGFKTGSIVPLKMPDEVVVSVEGQPFSTGEHGVLNGHKSIKIKQMLRMKA